MLHTVLAALLGPLALAGSPDVTRASDTSSGLSCEIRSTETGGSLRLEAVAMSSVGASGDYDLVVSKSGGGGSSNVSQGGDFEVGPGEETVLGEVTLGPGDKARVKAELIVTSADGKTTCKDTFPQLP